MLTPLIYAFRITCAIILAATIVICMSYEQECSYSSTTNNKTAQGQSWNRLFTSGIHLGMDLVEGGRHRVQSGTPHEMSQSECAPINNNITSAGTPLGMNLSNSSPMLGNSYLYKTTRNSQKRTQSKTHRNSRE